MNNRKITIEIIFLMQAVMLAWGGERVPIDAHRESVYDFSITNDYAMVQTVSTIQTSCACLKAVIESTKEIAPGAIVPLKVTLDPTGMEGSISKKVLVKLVPSGREILFPIREMVRLRCGLKPNDAAFGIVQTRRATGHEMTLRLSGYTVTNDTTKIVGLVQPPDSQFMIRIGERGQNITVTFRMAHPLPGLYVETWRVKTNDAEVPEIVLVVSAQVVDGLSISPRILTLDGESSVAARFVSLRMDNCCAFRILSAETLPRKWGDVTIEPQPLNGWRVKVLNIESSEVRQFSKRPYLRIRTDLKDLETIDVPLRVMTGGVQ